MAANDRFDFQDEQGVAGLTSETMEMSTSIGPSTLHLTPEFDEQVRQKRF